MEEEKEKENPIRAQIVWASEKTRSTKAEQSEANMSVDKLIDLGAILTVIEMMITRLLPKWRKWRGPCVR